MQVSAGRHGREARRRSIRVSKRKTGELIEASSLHIDDGTLGGRGGGTPCAKDQNGADVCFPGNPFDTYGKGFTGECTWYAAGRRPDLYGITTGHAKRWLDQARGKVPIGTVPTPGAIAVRTSGEFGHVMYVKQVVDNGATVIVDDSNSKNDHVVRYNLRVATSTIAGYIYGGPAVDSRNTTTGSPGGGAAVSPGSQLISVSWRGPAKLAHDLLGHRRPSVEWAADDRRRWHHLLQASRRDQPHFRLDQCLRAGPGSHATDLLDDSGQPWNGPLTIGGAGTTYSAPAAVINPTTGLISVFAQGPGNSLSTYWVTAGQPWNGPQTIGGAGTTYSAPAAVINPTTGLISVFAQGPGNSLSTYWVTAGQPWNGPQTIGGAGTTYSAPAAVINPSSQLISAFAQGPGNSLSTYWVTAGQPVERAADHRRGRYDLLRSGRGLSTPAASSSARSRRVPATA